MLASKLVTKMEMSFFVTILQYLMVIYLISVCMTFPPCPITLMKKENVLAKGRTDLLLRDGSYLLFLGVQLHVAEDITNIRACEATQFEKKSIKCLQPGFLIPVVTCNEETHHTAINFSHLHILLRLALR